jgi:FkbM family methyltransferase
MIKKFSKKIIKLLGFQLRRSSAHPTSEERLVELLKKFSIELLLDVGANAGQFALGIRKAGYKGDIVSFEPLSTAHAVLKKISKEDQKWIIHPRCAIGESAGSVEVNIAGNSASSSLLPMLESHILAAPHTAYIGKESVALITLDSLAEEYKVQSKKVFIKIDTQGYEWNVISGAKSLLPYVQGLELEMSLVPLYEGQHLWREIVSKLEDEGFNLWYLEPEFINEADGRMLQMNGIFFRRAKLA